MSLTDIVRASKADLPPPPALDPARTAVFADLDGTLAAIEAAPSAVMPQSARTEILTRLSRALDGRFAVISGRELADLDRILEGAVTPIAAVHGLVRREPSGEVRRAGGASRAPEAVAAFRALARAKRGLLVEDKGAAAALHYRGAPGAGGACRELAGRLGKALGLEIQEGDHVVELRAQGPDKGDAIRAFMSEPPFAGSTPVFVGDDLTDEAGFAAVRELGGWGVIVGRRRPTRALYALGTVNDALSWLAAVAPAR
jgi:trehalose 6-phosphate phosphatase